MVGMDGSWLPVLRFTRYSRVRSSAAAVGSNSLPSGGAAPGQPPAVTTQSPAMGQQFLSAPPCRLRRADRPRRRSMAAQPLRVAAATASPWRPAAGRARIPASPGPGTRSCRTRWSGCCGRRACSSVPPSRSSTTGTASGLPEAATASSRPDAGHRWRRRPPGTAGRLAAGRRGDAGRASSTDRRRAGRRAAQRRVPPGGGAIAAVATSRRHRRPAASTRSAAYQTGAVAPAALRSRRRPGKLVGRAAHHDRPVRTRPRASTDPAASSCGGHCGCYRARTRSRSGPRAGRPGQLPPGQYGAGQYGADHVRVQGQYGAPQAVSGPGTSSRPASTASTSTACHPGRAAVPGRPVRSGRRPRRALWPGRPGRAVRHMPGQYGPGGQFGPDRITGGRTRRRPLTFGKITLPRSPLILAIAGAAVVAIVAIVAVLSLSGSPGTPSGTSPTAAGQGRDQRPTASSSASGPEPDRAAGRGAAVGLPAQAERPDHAAVTDAQSLNVESCGKNLGADAQTFSTSAANRETLLAKLADLPGPFLASSGAMISDLTGAWQASASVDTDLAKWANPRGHRPSCHGGDLNYSSYKASISTTTHAGHQRQAGVRLRSGTPSPSRTACPPTRRRNCDALAHRGPEDGGQSVDRVDATSACSSGLPASRTAMR